ncbi:conserved hypothetical protein [Trichinella spiralis]|uniref:hypothetical protein n=1 Tax=Trichinella spiralis TaxID=6334 RepID=UPI0001EFC307|nr:conserved hypothetical protein [Trichinella spiralis]
MTIQNTYDKNVKVRMLIDNKQIQYPIDTQYAGCAKTTLQAWLGRNISCKLLSRTNAGLVWSMTINVHHDGLLGSPNYAVGTKVLLVNGKGKFEPQTTGFNLCRAAWRRNAVQDAQEEAPLPSGYRFGAGKLLGLISNGGSCSTRPFD